MSTATAQQEQTQPFTLYHLTNDLNQFVMEIVEAGGEISPEMEERWQELLQGLQFKGAGVYRAIRNLEKELEGIKKERTRLQDLERVTERSMTRLKERMMGAMMAAEKTELKTDIGTIRVQKSPPKLELLVAPEELPERFQRVTISANNSALSQAIKDGDEEAKQYGVLTEGYHLRLY